MARLIRLERMYQLCFNTIKLLDHFALATALLWGPFHPYAPLLWIATHPFVSQRHPTHSFGPSDVKIAQSFDQLLVSLQFA